MIIPIALEGIIMAAENVDIVKKKTITAALQ